jgi:uncharacterized protein (DUF58 family)
MNQVHTSLLPTARGIVLLGISLLGLIGGVLWGQPVFVFVGALFFALWVGDLIALALGLRGWAFDLSSGRYRVGPNPAWFGSEIGIHWTGTSAGTVSLQLPPSFEFLEESDGTVVVAARHRGWFDLDAIGARSGPFGCWKMTARLSKMAQVIVWPEVSWIGVSQAAAEIAQGPTDFSFSLQDDVAVREYLPGDPLRRIHWRSTARRGELMTRAETPEDPRQMLIELRLGSQAVIDPAINHATAKVLREQADAITERGISIAASLCLAAATAGVKVSFLSGTTQATGPTAQLLNWLAGYEVQLNTPHSTSTEHRILITDDAQDLDTRGALVVHVTAGLPDSQTITIDGLIVADATQPLAQNTALLHAALGGQLSGVGR